MKPMPSPRLEIRYCTQCKFMLRAAWLAQEMLATFEKELAEVAILPGSGGIFEVTLDGQTIFSNKESGLFPDVKQIKQLLRDRIAPGKTIGHEPA
jgi:selenoprotein W-related protein